MSYTIRTAMPEDAPVIAYQRRMVFKHTEDTWYLEIAGIDEAFVRWVTPLIVSGEYLGWFVLDETGEIVAGGGLRLFEWNPQSPDAPTRRAYINNVFVEEAHRRKGIARLLTTTMLDWCRAEKIHHVTLYASDQARHLYELLGFEMTSEMRLILA